MAKKIGMLLALVAILGVGVAAGGWWWEQRAPVAVAAQTSPQLDVRQASYVTLDKIVVMLKTDQSLRTANTYMSLDLVLRTDKLHEKAAKAELPMLKGVAVRTLSQVAMEQAKARGEGATVYKGRLVDIASMKQAEVIVKQAEMIASA